MDKELQLSIARYETGEASRGDIERIEKALESGKLEPENIPGVQAMLDLVDKSLDDRLPVQDNDRFLMLLERIENEVANPVKTKKPFVRMPARIRQAIQVAAILAIGLVAGYLIGETGKMDTEIAGMQKQIDEIRTRLTDQPIARKRLDFVRQAASQVEMDDQLANALLTALVHDPNINVRLASLEVLARHTRSPHLREGLIRSIPFQDAPIVQLRLAEYLRFGEVKGAAPALKAWLEEHRLGERYTRDFLYQVSRFEERRKDI